MAKVTYIDGIDTIRGALELVVLIAQHVGKNMINNLDILQLCFNRIQLILNRLFHPLYMQIIGQFFYFWDCCWPVVGSLSFSLRALME